MNELASYALAVVLSASPAFPKWQQVTPETMLKPVPVVLASNDVPGSVTRYPKSKPLSESCGIKEAGKLIGYRLGCD